jgi:hypothetical protein
MLIAIVIALYTLIVFFDFLPKRSLRDKKCGILYGVLLSVSFCVLILYCLDIPVPSPSVPIKQVVEMLFKPSNNLYRGRYTMRNEALSSRQAICIIVMLYLEAASSWA